MEHCRTYSTAVLVIEKSESPLSSTSKRNREDNRATRVSDQSSLWPGSVPGWQPSRERLPPASWAEVGLGVGMMALSCAVCAGWNTVTVVLLLIRPWYLPVGNNTSKIYRQPTNSQYCRYWVFVLSMLSDFKGAIADNLHYTQSPRQEDYYYYYTSTYIY